MLLAPYYREFELPWEDDPESNERFRKILKCLLALLILLVAVLVFALGPHEQRNAASTALPGPLWSAARQ